MKPLKYAVSSLEVDSYIEIVRKEFENLGSPERAEQQAAYMRDKFAFYGIAKPEMVKIAKFHFQQLGVFEGKKLSDFILLCLQDEYREIHYLALEMIAEVITVQPASFIKTLEKAVCISSWWDSVDALAKQIGIHFLIHPELQEIYAEKWITGKNMWLQRVAIIHQLLYKKKTNEKLLFALIRKQAANPEFFIRKACGWALRQHAKTEPEKVSAFLKQVALSPLTVREAEKQLKLKANASLVTE